MKSKPSQILGECVEIFEEGRWIQNSLVDTVSGKGDCFCAMGAISHVAYDYTSEKYPNGNTALRFLRKAIGEKNVVSWNDRPGRKVGSVIRAFKRAQKIALAAGR